MAETKPEMPHFPLMHEMTTDHVHEEIQLLANDFSTMLFETLGYVPRWRDYYLAHVRIADPRGPLGQKLHGPVGRPRIIGRAPGDGRTAGYLARDLSNGDGEFLGRGRNRLHVSARLLGGGRY